MFAKILIANRGEIAVRIIRACKELGIKTVAVYSEADAEALHVRFADESVCIGPGPSSDSYLNIPGIISAAEITDVEAIHPGYGFLAENPHFAEICQSCQIQFIGPSPESIRLMGDKMAAKNLMKKVGIPIIPGSDDVVKTKEEALKVAKKIKYPIVLKAVAGGGGKGMRVAHNDVRLVSAFYTVQSEAENAFGNPDIYIEKYFEKPRHIEFQIIGDTRQRIIYLGERECSIQRRHQKLLEETPAAGLDSKIRRKMGEYAVRAAKAVNYVNAGTVEFLLDERDQFYFMEMNTRIQVEHPITEMVTGIDLIKEQIRVTAGEKLSFKQEDVKPSGHAIECRINAEDPDNNFMPSPGKILNFYPPGGLGVRVDTHIYSGYTIPTFYDSMIAKLIVHGKNRQEAIQKMQRGLDEFIVEPIKTTIPLHKKILQNPTFLKGKVYTNFIEEFLGVAEKVPL
ncbi:MAG: acetyl-CoA carboxylase biotin carboxylase subunit [Candidatus Omnitrophica bacterium]|nr:acetyl-CoA carboxylase biotin carboxylase subunit [Candidatus Omnitrophota bacterium]